MATYFVVQTYRAGRGGALVAESPLQASSSAHAMRLAERYSHTKDAVVAFSRSGNPLTGEYDDPVVLAQYGRTPPELEEMAA